MFKLVGADPELFLTRNGKIVSAIGKLGGTKEHPVPVPELGKGYAFQEDNVLVEYNIPPFKSPEQFHDGNMEMLSFLKTKIKNTHGQEYDLSIQASGEISEEDAADPRAHVFGCDPDFNVWTMEPNPRPFSHNPLLRSAGGHLHFGIKCTNAQAIRFVRALDIFVGTYSVIHDDDKQRRTLYGKAGSMRRKPYGLEYRVLSNFWLKNFDHIKSIWTLAGMAWKAANNPADQILDSLGMEAQHIINTSDVAAAKNIWSKLT